MTKILDIAKFRNDLTSEADKLSQWAIAILRIIDSAPIEEHPVCVNLVKDLLHTSRVRLQISESPESRSKVLGLANVVRQLGALDSRSSIPCISGVHAGGGFMGYYSEGAERLLAGLAYFNSQQERIRFEREVPDTHPTR